MTFWLKISKKINTTDTLDRLIREWRTEGKKVVFTNGCFDILHQGHVTYLAQARDLGDKLIVALNTDASVKMQNKGSNRPINPETARLIVLAALEMVDAVVLFDGATPIDLIQQIQPDILVKGGDYDPDQTDPKHPQYMVGREEVLSNGGRVMVLPTVEGFSTTAILRKGEL